MSSGIAFIFPQLNWLSRRQSRDQASPCPLVERSEVKLQGVSGKNARIEGWRLTQVREALWSAATCRRFESAHVRALQNFIPVVRDRHGFRKLASDTDALQI